MGGGATASAATAVGGAAGGLDPFWAFGPYLAASPQPQAINKTNPQSQYFIIAPRSENNESTESQVSDRFAEQLSRSEAVFSCA